MIISAKMQIDGILPNHLKSNVTSLIKNADIGKMMTS